GSYYPWSVSLGTDYRIADKSAVSVTLKDSASGKTWTFNEKKSDYSGNYFSIDSGGYGSGTCIIFRPKTSEVSYASGSRFEVNISGLQNRFGEETSLSYSVAFFSLNKTNVSIRLSQTSLKLLPGQSETLTATVTPDDPDGEPVVWSSDKPDVATVDENGKVTAASLGDAVITASYMGKTASCKVAVRDYSIDRTELLFDLAEGAQTETLTVSDGIQTVTDVTWSSTDESVAKVSKKDGRGVVTPTGAGTAQILAQIKNGPSFTCTVTVKKDILSAISLNLSECTLEKGEYRRLRVYFVPNDTTLSKELTWVSDRPDVAAVDSYGTVTALSKGTAIITVSASASGTDSLGTLTAQCSVTVTETAEPAQDNIPSNLAALTNVQPRLSDVSLQGYPGWEWENGDLSLAQFAGMQEKSFAAIYHQDGYADYKTALNVSLATLTGVSIKTDRTALGANESAEADIQWKLSGSEAVLSEYMQMLQWNSSDPSVLQVQTADTGSEEKTAKVRLQAGSTSGKATVTAQLTLGGKTYTARQTFTVAGNTAVLERLTADGLEPVAQSESAPLCWQGTLADETSSLSATISNTTKLTVKSGNPKVVSVGKVSSTDGSFLIPLTLKAAGTAKLTLTANDAAKTKIEVLVYVKDPRPNLGADTVTVNKLQTAGSTLSIYPNDGYEVTECGLTGADAALFEPLTAGTEADSYHIKAKKDTPKGSYRLTVKVTTTAASNAAAGSSTVAGSDAVAASNAAAGSDAVAGSSTDINSGMAEALSAATENQADTAARTAAASYELPLTVKVTEQAPKYKIKQSVKANLFYKDLGAPKLTITTEEPLSNLELTGCDFKLTDADNGNSYTYTLAPNLAGSLTSSCNTKGTLQLGFEGYETISAPFTVGVENKKPKLTLENKTVTLYPNAGVTSARLHVKSGKQTLALDAAHAALDNAATEKSGFTLTQMEDALKVSMAASSETTESRSAATHKLAITLTHDNWTESVSLPLTVKLNLGKPALKLQKSSLQLNANMSVKTYDMAETEILWKNGALFDADTAISVSAANAKAQAVIHKGIVFEQAGNKLLVRLNNQDIAAGSYSFKVHAVGMPGVSASLTVKVVNVELAKSLKLSAKGSIDVLNRSGSYVTVTPSLKSLNGTVTDVSLSGAFAHLFRAELDENNKILIRAGEADADGGHIALITKYNYPVKLTLTLRNADGETMRITAPELKLKLKQGKPKVTMTPKNPVFYSGAYNGVRLDANAVLKGADDLDIIGIELINQTALFDYSDGVLRLQNGGAAAKGKTYSLQFKITFKGQADNEKATIVKVNAKVK
ncbi:MAG: Ig-like domain-containing protein, partial [Muribaculum sp.]|nr:Ig-like domain-containing protein [Muribaculum sp.]